MSEAAPPEAAEADGEEGDGQGALASFRAGAAEAALLMRLQAALRVGRLHSLENVAAREVLKELHAELGTFLRASDRAMIVLGEGRRVYVNGRIARAQRGGGGEWLESFVDQFAKSGLAGLVLSGVWSPEATRGLVSAFVSGALAARGPAERVKALQAALAAVPAPAHAAGLDPEEAANATREEVEGYLSEAQRAAFYYTRLLVMAELAWKAVGTGGSPDVLARNVRQTLMKIVEGLESGLFEARLVALTAVEAKGSEPDVAHSARVAVLCMVMGRLLGLVRGNLADLGLAALHHDLGRVGLERRAAPDGASEDPESVAAHVAHGVQICLRGRTYASAELLRLVVAHEHHRIVDDVPDESYLGPPHPLSEVVALADAFDRHEHGVGGRPALGAGAALHAVEASGKHRPAALAVLVEALGRHPRGSVLRLASGDVVVVLADGGRVGDRPMIRRVLLSTGAPDPVQPVGRLPDRGVIAADLGPGVQLDWRTVLLS